MLRYLYRLGIAAMALGMRLLAPWNSKMRLGVQGRQNWPSKLIAIRKPGETWWWFHCASLGEFEQARNLIDDLHAKQPSVRLMVTFFSPSGYEIRKAYPKADAVMYLPLDRPSEVQKWLDLLQPSLVFWVKYELWLQHLSELAQREIPMLLVSARVRADSRFLTSPLAPLYRQAFAEFRHIFAQDDVTLRLLQDFIDHNRISVSSDTRFDRVMANRQSVSSLPEIESFIRGRLCIVVGSSWQPDEEVLLPVFDELANTQDLCMIIAPHEIKPPQLNKRVQESQGQAILYSQIANIDSKHNLLWIDNIGMLSRLYYYADVAYVGGGWGSGLHNILEAAVFGCPVLFGPQHHKFPEAADLIEAGGGFAIQGTSDLSNLLSTLLSDEASRNNIQQVNRSFIASRAGATQHILDWCREAGYVH